jgi:hypothetical protein
MGKGLLERLGLRRPPRLTLEAFRNRVINEILGRRPSAEVRAVGDAEVELVGGGVTNVARGHAHYLEQPGQLRLLLQQLRRSRTS